MSNKKLYMLKVACARLHGLKVQERRYKGALVKRACMHLLVKQGAYKDPRLGDNAIPYDLLRDTSEIDAKADWNSGFWGTALGKFLRPYFENAEHENAYIKRLSKFRHMPATARRMAQMKELSDMGVDPSKWESIIAETDRFTSGYAEAEKEHHTNEANARQKSWSANREELKRLLAESDREGRDSGWIPKDDYKSRRGHYGGPGWMPRYSGYLTDQQAIYDPEFGRAWGLSRGGSVVNNYYYGIGPDGKPIKVGPDGKPDTPKPSDPPKPGATTPGTDPNPDLPGLSSVLNPSTGGAGYLSGLKIDPSKISLTAKNPDPGLPTSIGGISTGIVPDPGAGIPALTTTGDPGIDLGSGTISLDPSSLTSAIMAPAAPPSATMSAIDTGSTIGHDLLGIIPGGDDAVDRATDWAKATYADLPDWGKEVADTAVTGVKDMASKPKASDPSSALYIPK